MRAGSRNEDSHKEVATTSLVSRVVKKNLTLDFIMFICSRCGETVTVPYFYKGGVYGYTCIDIVSGGKRKKQAFKLQELEVVSITLEGDCPRFNKPRFTVLYHEEGYKVKTWKLWLVQNSDGVFCDDNHFLHNDKLYRYIFKR